MEYVNDYITGRQIPLIGPEANRQAVEQLLVGQKGYARQDIAVDVPIDFEIDGDRYQSYVDLLVRPDGGRALMVIKCAAGSLESCQREIVAAARLLQPIIVPLAVASDGRNAFVYDAVDGRRIGQGLRAIPAKSEALEYLRHLPQQTLSVQQRQRQQLIFRSYDSMKINRHR